MTTQPSDWAVAQAWREVTAGMPFAYPDNLINAVNDRARELDASGTTNSAQISSSLVVEQREDGAVRASASRQAHDMLIDLRAAASIGRPITGDELHELEQDILRALEQALTQKRGLVVGTWQGNAAARGEPGGPVKWADGLTYSSIPDGTMLYTTPQPSADAVREIYDAAAKGFHTSETNGAERKYLHVIRFQSIEDLHGYEDAWTAAMVKARDAK